MITEYLGGYDIRTTLTGYQKLIAFYNRCERYKNEEIIVSFDKLTWLDANMAALIFAIFNKLEDENGLTFYVDQDQIRDRFQILIRNGFLSGVEFVPTSSKTAVKLEGFNKDDDTNFIAYIHKELLSHRSLPITTTEKYLLTDAFLELFCNVQKHARTDSPVFACGQFYPTHRRLNFTLVDSGVGYLVPIQEYTNGEISTASEAILWALKGNTTKRGVPGGLGLTEIQNFCKTNGARFDIITGGAYWSNDFSVPKKVKPFCGTIVNVIFDCS